jgi:cytochrome c oxidase subunit III
VSVTRSMEATADRAVAAVARQRRAQPSGWWGVVLLIATEVTFFACLIATYFYLRFKNGTWPPGGIEKPSVTLPLVYTGILLASTVPMFLAVRAAKLGRSALAWSYIAVATAIQGTYLGLQIHQFVSDYHSFTPQDNAYGSIYFLLPGAHHAHVVIGLLANAFLLAKLLGGLTNYRLIGVRVTALYWYFVALVQVPIVFTQLYPSL